jgi:predicted alpha/beta superfamily hydrolase
MPNAIQKIIDGKKVSIFRDDADTDIVVYCTSINDDWNSIIQCCKSLKCNPFHLVLISNTDWDESLSPWAAGNIVSNNDNFEGKAQEYLQWILDKVVPIAPQGHKLIAGYSMAGLFALYVPYISSQFEAVATASGSLWYPQFYDFVVSHEPLINLHSVYLSIGDKESISSNKYLKKTVDITRQIFDHFKSHGVNTTFELNQGNHFKDYNMRLAKAITWIVAEQENVK